MDLLLVPIMQRSLILFVNLDLKYGTVSVISNHIGVDYIGIGADYDGVPLTPVDAEDVSKYPNVFAELIQRGWTEEDLAKIAGGNIIRVFKDVEKVTRVNIFINISVHLFFNFEFMLIVC